MGAYIDNVQISAAILQMNPIRLDFGVFCSLEGKSEDLREPSWFWNLRESDRRAGKSSQDPSADLDRLITVITQPS